MQAQALLALMLVAAPDYRAQVITDLTTIQRAATALEEAIGPEVPPGIAAAVSSDLLSFCPTMTPAPCQGMKPAFDGPALLRLVEAVRIGFSARIASARALLPQSPDTADPIDEDVADFTAMAEADTAFLLKLKTLLQPAPP